MRFSTSVSKTVAAAAAMAMVSPAMAQDRDRERERHNDNTGAAVAGVAVAAILGAAILGSHHGHHRDDTDHRSNTDSHAEFERGFRDGQHDGQFVNYDHNQAYVDGFAAGQRERENRLHSSRYRASARQRHGDDHRADLAGQCAREADSYWRIPSGSTSTYDVRSTGNNMYTVQVAAGYMHGTCTVEGNGNVRLIRNN